MHKQNDQKDIKEQLERELGHEVFTKQSKNNVISQTHPRTFPEKLVQWWNKEITIPLIPIGGVLLIFITVGSLISVMDNGSGVQRQMIERGGNIYWSDMLENGVDDH